MSSQNTTTFNNKNDNLIVLFLGISAILAMIFPFIFTDPIKPLMLLFLFLLSAVVFTKPKLGLILLILARPCLDIFTSEAVISLGSISLNFASLLAMLTLAFALRMAWLNRTRLKELPLRKSWLFFLLATFLSIFISFNFVSSLTEWVRLLSIFAMYLLGALIIKNKNDLYFFLKIVVLSAVIPALLAFYQFYAGTGISLPFEGIYNRIFGTFAHPNLFAYYLILPITMLLFLALSWNFKKISNLVYALTLPLFIILLVLTFTRGAWLAFLIIIFIIGIIRYRKLMLVSAIGVVLLFFLVQPIQDRIMNFVSNPYSSIAWRQELWTDAIKYAPEKPILGHGTGMANELILSRRGYSKGSSDAHNDYLKILLESGLIGLSAYFLLVLSLLNSLYRRYRLTDNKEYKILLFLLLALTPSLYFMSFADNIIRNTALQWTYWTVIGSVLFLKDKK